MFNLTKKLIYFSILIICLYPSITYSSVKSKQYVYKKTAKLLVINRLTQFSKVINIHLNQVKRVDRYLQLQVKQCSSTTSNKSPEHIVFLEVVRTSYNDNTKPVKSLDIEIPKEFKITNTKHLRTDIIFSGWMFANHSDYSDFTDTVYDISVISCL